MSQRNQVLLLSPSNDIIDSNQSFLNLLHQPLFPFQTQLFFTFHLLSHTCHLTLKKLPLILLIFHPILHFIFNFFLQSVHHLSKILLITSSSLHLDFFNPLSLFFTCIKNRQLLSSGLLKPLHDVTFHGVHSLLQVLENFVLVFKLMISFDLFFMNKFSDNFDFSFSLKLSSSISIQIDSAVLVIRWELH